MSRVTIGELFDELRQRNEAAWNDPAAAARRDAASAEWRARIDAEIAAGIRDEDGEVIEPERDEDEGDEDAEFDPDADPDEF